MVVADDAVGVLREDLGRERTVRAHQLADPAEVGPEVDPSFGPDNRWVCRPPCGDTTTDYDVTGPRTTADHADSDEHYRETRRPPNARDQTSPTHPKFFANVMTRRVMSPTSRPSTPRDQSPLLYPVESERLEVLEGFNHHCLGLFALGQERQFQADELVVATDAQSRDDPRKVQ